MQPVEAWRRTLRRADVRIAGLVGSAIAFVISITGGVLYAHDAVETLEEADLWFHFILVVSEQQILEQGAGVAAAEGLRAPFPEIDTPLRLRDAEGRVVASRGRWPAADRRIAVVGEGSPERSLSTALRFEAGDYLVGAGRLASGHVVELALPLERFHGELAEVRRRLVGESLVSAVAAFLVGVAATLWAFSPLRRATSLLEGVDAGSLGRRLPSRGTGDPIDAHANTLNRVLEDIDASFARVRAFGSNVAHELRTPLNRISNVTEVALLGDSERGLRAALETVRGTTEQLAQVVHSLLLLAEIDDQRFVLEPVPIDLQAWVGRTADVYAAPFEEAGVKLVARCDASALRGDRILLDRVLVNLLDNALAHAPPGSSVELAATPRGADVVVSVDDAGPGVPAEERERVFDRFARGGDAARTAGHGLGLALARAIVRLHGGDLRVGDSHLGGARFEATLPAKPAGNEADGRGRTRAA